MPRHRVKNNHPVTQQEISFAAHQRPISQTNPKGIIVYCNDDFVTISGFSREELIGKPHSIVPHPDTPETVFAEMWSHLENGKCWMPTLKNRCKNGYHYWVSIYITPVLENGYIVGYESESVAQCIASERSSANQCIDSAAFCRA